MDVIFIGITDSGVYNLVRVVVDGLAGEVPDAVRDGVTLLIVWQCPVHYVNAISDILQANRPLGVTAYRQPKKRD